MKKKKEELELALRGNMSSHQRMMLKTMITHMDFLNEQIVELDLEVAKRLAPFQQDLDRLDSIPGIAQRTAEQILAEVGTDIASCFPSAAHLCSWVGIVPGNHESAGKRKSSKIRKGNNISVPLLSKPPTLYGDLIIISGLNTNESQPAKESTERPLPLHIPS